MGNSRQRIARERRALIEQRDDALKQIQRLEDHRDLLHTVNMNNALVCDGLKWQRDEARRWARFYRAETLRLRRLYADATGDVRVLTNPNRETRE